MTWGTQNTEKEAFEQMDYSLEQGVNFFDTAELYSVPPTPDSYGKTEIIIGNWFEKRKNREKIVLATKVAGPGCDWIRGGGNNFSEKNLGKAIDDSLKRLKTDYIDLYQLHWPERSTNCFGRREFSVNDNEKDWNNFESILKALEKFIKIGKIRYIGMSNETPYGLSKNSRMSLFKGWERMINPLAMKAYDEYSKLAKEKGITMVQLAQAFVNSRPFVTSNIIGATSMVQLKENIESIDVKLDQDTLDKINLIHNNNPNPAP
jgi:aryl-alcohol dehydrogenase-like predicted oxidoreductase